MDMQDVEVEFSMDVPEETPVEATQQQSIIQTPSKKTRKRDDGGHSVDPGNILDYSRRQGPSSSENNAIQEKDTFH